MVAGWEELRKGNLIYTLNLIAYSDKWLSVGCCPRFLFCVSNEMREHQRRQKKKKRNNKEGNSRDYSRAASNQQRYITFGIMNCYFAVKKKKKKNYYHPKFWNMAIIKINYCEIARSWMVTWASHIVVSCQKFLYVFICLFFCHCRCLLLLSNFSIFVAIVL